MSGRSPQRISITESWASGVAKRMSAPEGDLEPAAEGRAVDGGDHGLGQVRQTWAASWARFDGRPGQPVDQRCRPGRAVGAGAAAVGPGGVAIRQAESRHVEPGAERPPLARAARRPGRSGRRRRCPVSARAWNIRVSRAFILSGRVRRTWATPSVTSTVTRSVSGEEAVGLLTGQRVGCDAALRTPGGPRPGSPAASSGRRPATDHPTCRCSSATSPPPAPRAARPSSRRAGPRPLRRALAGAPLAVAVAATRRPRARRRRPPAPSQADPVPCRPRPPSRWDRCPRSAAGLAGVEAHSTEYDRAVARRDRTARDLTQARETEAARTSRSWSSARARPS